ncbi:MAG: GtrA family protein [Prevotellaceae bacterium]|jgi:putative flippase GtrA|nr:GtrA family protein [Prevotellaceae bacterium]
MADGNGVTPKPTRSKWSVLRREAWLFVKAQVSAQLSTIADFAVTILLAKFFSTYYLYATFTGAVVGGIVNCVINYAWVFKARNKKLHVAMRYLLVWTGSILFNTWGTFTVTEWLKRMKWVHYLLGYYVQDVFILSKIIVAMLVAFLWNYSMQRVFVYRPKN